MAASSLISTPYIKIKIVVRKVDLWLSGQPQSFAERFDMARANPNSLLNLLTRDK